MSSDVCRTCKNSTTCTYPRNQIIIQCEEYDYAEPRSSGEAASKSDMAQCCLVRKESAAPSRTLHA